MTRLPVIAIVGRPNVGKSSILNALVGKRISIVEDIPGVTRDRISTPFQIDGRWIELVDTGGYGFVDPDQLTEHIKHQIELAMSSADLVMFIVDVQTGLTTADQEIAQLLRRQGIKTLLVANKADGTRSDTALGEFARLGLGTPIGVSAKTDRNIDQLVDEIRKNVDLANAPTDVPVPSMLVAIVGKRNAGKSTLVNSIAEIYEGAGDRVIVSEIPGTTRDSVDVRIEKDGQTLIVIDTAGVRKKRQMVTHDIEFYSFHRAQRSVRRADVVLLLIDATEPISEPDRKLAQYVEEQRKPVVIIINKWDLAKEILREQASGGGRTAVDDREIMEQYREYVDAELRNLDYAPLAFITAKDGKNVQAILDQAQRLMKQASLRMSTGQLNRVVRQVLQERTPSTPSGRKARIFYATQIEVAPPTIVLMVNKPEYLDEQYQRFMINRLRELLPYPEVPISLVIRPRTQRTTAKSLDERREDELSEEQLKETRTPSGRAKPAFVRAKPASGRAKPTSGRAKPASGRAKPAPRRQPQRRKRR